MLARLPFRILALLLFAICAAMLGCCRVSNSSVCLPMLAGGMGIVVLW